MARWKWRYAIPVVFIVVNSYIGFIKDAFTPAPIGIKRILKPGDSFPQELLSNATHVLTPGPIDKIILKHRDRLLKGLLSNDARNPTSKQDVLRQQQHIVTSSQEVNVLLNSYMRCGSSYMGRILGYRDDTFYFYEPLWTGNIWVYHADENKLCHTMNPFCIFKRNALKNSFRLLEKIYNCRLSQLGKGFSEMPHAWEGYSGTKWHSFVTCRKRSPQNTVYVCLKEMENVCNKYKYRVTKVLRLLLRDAALLLDKIPHLKIVHLFRDPRAIINSHITTKWFPLKEQDFSSIIKDAMQLCKRLEQDLDSAVTLMNEKPTQIRAIQYEDFYDPVKKAQLLYTFLGMDSPRDVIEFVERLPPERNVTEAPKLNMQEKFKLFRYRDTLPWKITELVEKYCSSVITKMGLRTYDNESNYKDPKFEPFLNKLKFALEDGIS